MTAPRSRCPAADLWGDRHMVTDRRWTLTTPDGEEIVLCSAACVLSWICYALPAEVEASRRDGEAA